MSKNQLVILRREYLELTGDYCAAKLLAVFEHWSNFKLGGWVYMSLEQLHQELLGEHSQPIIRRGLKRLKELELLQQSRHPAEKWNHTHCYCLDLNALQTRCATSLPSEGKNLPIDRKETTPSMPKKLTNNNTVTSTVTDSQKQIFYRLKAEWERFPSMRTVIREEITAHPEWQLHIVNDAIEIRAA